MGKCKCHHCFSYQKLILFFLEAGFILWISLHKEHFFPWFGMSMFQVKHPVYWGHKAPIPTQDREVCATDPSPETHTLADTGIMAILACHSLQPKSHLCSLRSLHNLTSRSQLHLFSLCSCVSSIDTNFAFNKGWVPMNSVLYYQLVLIRD